MRWRSGRRVMPSHSELRSAVLAVPLVLTACSGQPSDPPVPGPERRMDAEPAPPPVVVERVLAGGGLPGLPGYDATLLSASEGARLMRLAYPDQPSQLVTVRDGDTTYRSRPLAALRLEGRVVLLVQNENVEDCHACSGRTSIFYFDAAGERLTHSFPLALEGADWGGPQDVQLVDIGGPTLLLGWDFQQMGYFFEGYELYRLADANVESLAEFPSLASNDGTVEAEIYRVRLLGAGISSDGRAVDLRYSGRQTTTASGAFRSVQEERSVTLDGTADAWVQAWGRQPW